MDILPQGLIDLSQGLMDLPELEQFLKDNKIVITETEFTYTQHACAIRSPDMVNSHEYALYECIYEKFRTEHIDPKVEFMHFLITRNTVASVVMLGDIYCREAQGVEKDDQLSYCIAQAVLYYRQSYEMGYIHGARMVANCYHSYVPHLDSPQFFKYAHLSADVHGDAMSCGFLYMAYHHSDTKRNLHKARHYCKLCIGAGDDDLYYASCMNEVELDLLGEFETKLNKDDLLLAHELKKKHEHTGLQELQKEIEKEYFKVLSLIKDLSNIVVSYLL